MGNTGDGTYIKLYRKLVDWEWYQHIPTKVMFVHLLVIANWNESTFKGIKIGRGEVIRTLNNLSTETGLTIAQCRTALSHLISTKDITIKKAGKLRVIRVSNFLKYQENTNDSTILAQNQHDPAHDNSTILAPNSHRTNKVNKEKKDKKEIPAPAGEEAPPDDEGWVNADELVLQIQP